MNAVPQVEDKVKALTNGYGAHAVIVSVGVQAAYEQAVKLIRRKGTLVCVGLVSPQQPVPLSSYMMVVGGESCFCDLASGLLS